jgi:error-prone DNA polymerase
MAEGEAVADDYASLRLTLRAHPLALLRASLPARPAIVPAARLAGLADGRRVAVAGLVLVRQRPGTAKGVIFMTIEDETGVANLIVWPATFARLRPVVLGGRLVIAGGRLQKQGLVIHVIVDRMIDRSDLLAALAAGADPSPEPAAAGGPPPRPVARREPPAKSFPSRDFH